MSAMQTVHELAEEKLANFYEKFGEEVDLVCCNAKRERPCWNEIFAELATMGPLLPMIKNENYVRSVAALSDDAQCAIAVYDQLSTERKVLVWRYVNFFVDVVTESLKL